MKWLFLILSVLSIGCAHIQESHNECSYRNELPGSTLTYERCDEPESLEISMK